MESLRQPSHERFTVSDEADVGAVRRAVAEYARRLGADEVGRGRAGLVATELGTNLVRHAEPPGWMLVRPVAPHDVEIIAVDANPGMSDVARVLAGHVDSPRGLGCGLAAVRRASARFDLHSKRGMGTAVLAVVDVRSAPEVPIAGSEAASHGGRSRGFGGVSVAIAGACGDGWAVSENGHHVAVAVVDGLGHGPAASLAADAALTAFTRHPEDLAGYVKRANESSRSTRGAAVAVGLVRWPEREVDYVAVGNVSARLCWRGGERGLVSVGGTVGTQANAPSAPVTTYSWPSGGRLVLWTDGLSSRLELGSDPELMDHDPAIAAAMLYRRHARDRDDATVVVLAEPDAP
jgi:anti-sigma regulatory factor (Ser/Thr protein kinase)